MKHCNGFVTTKLLTIKEIVEVFGQGYWFWYTLIKNGELPFIQKEENGKILIDTRDVEVWKEKAKKTIRS
jgi:hypothetical protein